MISLQCTGRSWLLLTFITFLAVYCSLSTAYAEDPAENLGVGVAMHGDPALPPETSALPYVSPDAPKGGHLKQGVVGRFDTLNPYSLVGTPAVGLDYESGIYGRMTFRSWDEPFTLYPAIAQTIEIPEDRSALTVTLDPQATFSDGTPITADDIIFSFETLREKGRPNMRNVYNLVHEVVKKGKREVHFTLKEGHDRETAMVLAMMPVLSKNWWQGRDFDKAVLEPPVSSGAYIVERIDPGHSITYKRNPNYWAKNKVFAKGQYNFDRITYEYFRDDTVALEALQKGDLNLRVESDITKWAGAYQSDVLAQKGIIKSAFKHQRPGRIKALIFNLRRAKFEDVRVRKALSLAVDKPWLNQNLYGGLYNEAQGYFDNSDFAPEPENSEALSPREALRVADTLLNDAGLTVEEGKRALSFEILVNNPQDQSIALHFTKSLERLGITATVRMLDSASFTRRLMAHDYDMIMHHWHNSLSPGSEQSVYWSCEAARQEGSLNFSGICRSEIDALVAAIPDTKTYEDLTCQVMELDTLLREAVIAIPLFYQGQVFVAHHKDIKYPDKTAIYGPILEAWWSDAKNDPGLAASKSGQED